jgi:type I restriction enzyme R subunit
MAQQTPSTNFGFLRDYDPLLDEYALVAEWNVYTDPNTSLLKTGQFGELLAKSTACHAGMDCRDNKFIDIIGLLKRQRIIPKDVFEQFDLVRLYWNEAKTQGLSGSKRGHAVIDMRS